MTKRKAELAALALRVCSAVVLASSTLPAINALCPQSALAADEAALKTEVPQLDESKPVEPKSEVHKLGVSENAFGGALNDDSAKGQASADQSPLRGSTVLDAKTGDPLSAMTPQFDSSKRVLQGYAECDTGYGVCGVLLKVPFHNYAVIQKAFATMPAGEAGIETGDIVLSVNGRTTRGIPDKEVWDWFTGAPGTPVVLAIQRDDEVYQITIRRMDIGHIPDVRLRKTFLDFSERTAPAV